MGYGGYDSSARATRSASAGYKTKSVDQIFTQQRKRQIYEKMNPANVEVREACDSEEHPNVVPVQLYLDVTGSMGQIPHMFIKDGLPKMISEIIQAGVPDVALMFGAIGDHECDRYPLQVAQFESGDEELDYWLTHTYLEGGGGGNRGESYALAWYFAGNHVKTDAFDKRGKKGIVFTIGDEPVLEKYPARAVKELMEDSAALEQAASHTDLLDKAREQNEVYHIHIAHSYGSRDENRIAEWKELLGQNLLIVEDYSDIPKLIAKTVLQHAEAGGPVKQTLTETPATVDPTEATAGPKITL